MRHYLLTYQTGEDFLQRRAALRGVHLEHAWRAVQRGELLLGGALAAVGDEQPSFGPAHGALLIFQGDTPDGAETFARTDPYVLNGLVERWSVREWTTVVGENAAAPVRP